MYDPIKVIGLAMEMELYGHNFYKDNADKSQNLQTQSVFKRLADIELEHYEYLKNLLAKYKGEEVSEENLELPKEDGGKFFDDRKESENLEQNLEQSMIPDMNVLRMAYLIEEDFRDYYLSMSKKVDDDELKGILENFSRWEDGHASIFKDEYDRLMDQYMNVSWGGWFLKKDYTAILLSGGKSKRMGKSKQNLSYNGVYLMDTIVDNLTKHFSQIIIVSNDLEFFEKRYEDYKNKISIKSDIIKDKGPCMGLYTGLLSSTNEDNFLIACDMPYFSHAYIDFLKSKDYQKALVRKNSKYFEPFFSLYKKELTTPLKDYIDRGRQSLNGFLEEIDPCLINRNEILGIENIEKIFRNLNYPEDWDEYVKEINNGINKKFWNRKSR